MSKYMSLVLVFIFLQLCISPVSLAANYNFTVKSGMDIGSLTLDLEREEESFSEIVGVSLTRIGEFIYSSNDEEVGLGGEYLPQRKTIKKDAEPFGFYSIYALAGIRENIYFLRGKIGYNFFIPPQSQVVDPGISTTGGIYYGSSIGCNINDFEIEILYGVNNATITEENYNKTDQLRYSRFGFNMGYRF
ncbi:MAG: hypothetical protein ACOCRL_01845 [Bacillota bacterium]